MEDEGGIRLTAQSVDLSVPELRGLHHCDIDSAARNGVILNAVMLSGAGKAGQCSPQCQDTNLGYFNGYNG